MRTKFLIETINDLKNNKTRNNAGSTGTGASVNSELATRIRKMLGSLSSRKLESTEPLRIGLEDIEQSDKQGKWWLVGASWAGRDGSGNNGEQGETARRKKEEREQGGIDPAAEESEDDHILGSWGAKLPDVEELELLAREQGMNTNVRRSIFVTLLSAADYQDAHDRLLKLRLDKHDKREIPHVLMRCAGSEEQYNLYYGLVARQVCQSDQKIRWAFQDSLWKLFRRMGESLFGEEADEVDADDDDELLDLRRLVNIAKLYGFLVADGSLELGILKCLNIAHIRAKTRTFLEVFLITLFRESRKQAKSASGSRSGTIVYKRFRAVQGRPDLVGGLRYFLLKVMPKSRMVVGKREAAMVSKACGEAEKALEEALAGANSA